MLANQAIAISNKNCQPIGQSQPTTNLILANWAVAIGNKRQLSGQLQSAANANQWAVAIGNKTLASAGQVVAIGNKAAYTM